MAIKKGIPQIKPVYPVNIVDKGGIDSIAKQNILGSGNGQKQELSLQNDYISAAQKISTIPSVKKEPDPLIPVNLQGQSNTEQEPVVNPIQPETNTANSEQNPISNDNNASGSLLPIQEYNEVLDRINMNKQNAKVNIETANNMANAYLSNYLKKQGTYGSGMGASAQANLGSGYQKALAEIDQNYDEMANNALMDLNKDLLSAGQKLGTSNDVSNYIDSLKSQSGVSSGTLNALEMYKQSLENQENQKNIEDWRKTTLTNLNGYTTSESAQNYYDSISANPNIDDNTKATIEAYINSLKEEEAETAKTKAEQDRNSMSANYYNTLTSGLIDNIDDFDKYYEKYKSEMTDADIKQADIYREMLETMYERNLNDIGFSIASEDPQGESVSLEDSAIINKILKDNDSYLREGIKYNYNGKDVVYHNGEWKYAKKYKNEDGSIVAENALEEQFGNFFDTGKAGTKQSIYANTIINAAKEGKIKNNTVFNFNYGTGTGAFYEYKNGAWYKTSYNEVIRLGKYIWNYKNIETLLGKINY